jgi:hypothetical protein
MSKQQILFIILALALVTRLAVIQQPLWFDEAYTAMLIQLPFSDMWSAIIADVHPPTWYLIERVFSVLGTSEVVLRLPSLLLGMLAIYLTWHIARHLGDLTGLVAAGIMAVAPFTVYYSVEARVYALLMCATLVAIIGALERKPVLLCLGSMFILMSHNTGAVYMPAIGLLAWNRMGFRRAATWIAVGMIPWLLWLPTLLNQASVIGALGYWTEKIVGNHVVWMLTQINDQVFPQFAPDWVIPLNVVVTSILVIFPIAEAIRTRNGAALILAGLAFIPGIIGIVISLAWQPVMIARAMSGAFPFWVMLVAWWITSPRTWSMSQCALAGMISGLILATTISLPGWDRSTGLVGAMKYLNQNSAPSDLICHADSSTIVLTRYYLHRQTAILSYGNLSYTMSYETMQAAGLRLADPSQCNWLIYVKSPMLDDIVIPVVNRVLETNEAEVAYTIAEHKWGLAQLWRLKHVDRIAGDRAD